MTDQTSWVRQLQEIHPPTPEQKRLADALWLPIVPSSTPIPAIEGDDLQRLIEMHRRQWAANPQWRRRLRRAGWRVRYRWYRLVRWVSIATGHAAAVRRYRLLVAERDVERWIRELPPPDQPQDEDHR